MDSPSFAGFGVDKPYFSIVPKEGEVGNEIHLAFVAKGESILRAFDNGMRGEVVSDR